ncbi:MAG: ATP-binding protein [Bacteroidota bacterium]
MQKHLPFLQGGGQLGELIRTEDWSVTVLGAPENWTESLQSAVAISLSSGFPIAIYWGQDFTLLYNDAWSSIPGQKHPWALGKPGTIVWPEIWDGLKDEFESVLKEGKSHRSPDAPLYMHRNGYTEECYFDYTLSPITGLDGEIGGVFNAVIETTYRVINERRNALRNAFLLQVHASKTVVNAYQKLEKLFESAYLDIPFYALYQLDASSGNVYLKLSANLNQNQLDYLYGSINKHIPAELIQLNKLDVLMPEPAIKHWPEPITEAVIVPISGEHASIKGYLIMGASARKRVDEDYRQFYAAVGANTGTILNNAFGAELSVAYQNELLLNADLHEEQQALNEEVRAANEELAASNEELAASNEELATTNEELNQTQDELNETLRLLAENERRKDEFLSIASHELKTPLTGIKAFNQLMLRSVADPERTASYVEKSAENIMRLEKLINDLLDVTKLNAGKLNYDLQPFDFSAMLRDSVASFRLTVNTHQIHLQQAEGVVVTGDRMRLEQVINNFLSNAIKYSPDGDEVRVVSEISGSALIVSVQDFGIGIQQQHIQRLFDRYYRIDNTDMRFEGLGLGLFISSEILKRHSGTFWIESEPGKGSTFFFRLPLEENGELGPITENEQYYQDSHITIYQNQDRDWLEVDWIGFQTVDAVKSGGMRMLSMFKGSGLHKILNDNTHVEGTWSEASEWAGKEWFPMMEEAGLKYFAWVYSPSAFSRLSAEKAVDVKVGDTVIQFFTEAEAARSWLANLK